MSITLDNKQGLIAGDGILPVRMAQYAKNNGFEVVCISLANDNYNELKKYCSKIYSCHPGEVNKIEQILKDIPYGGHFTVHRIQKVVEDGNVD